MSEEIEKVSLAQQALMTAGQRRINLIWELTQAIIAVAVSLGTLYVVGCLVLQEGSGASSTALLLLSNAFFMIITSYFQRTNHVRSSSGDPKETR